MSACLQCGKEVGPLRTKRGSFTRGVDISIMDKDGLFCRLRCAAEYGVEKAKKVKRK